MLADAQAEESVIKYTRGYLCECCKGIVQGTICYAEGDQAVHFADSFASKLWCAQLTCSSGWTYLTPEEETCQMEIA